jgi:hypothetical protein
MNSTRSIFEAHITNSSTCVVIKKEQKSPTWCSSPLCKDANFPPHQPLAEYQLPCSQKPLVSTPTPIIPLFPTNTM